MARVAGDVLRLVLSLLRPHGQLAAENLFLRKQLASYLERKIKLRRADAATAPHDARRSSGRLGSVYSPTLDSNAEPRTSHAGTSVLASRIVWPYEDRVSYGVPIGEGNGRQG
jgi:hypothetical protein